MSRRGLERAWDLLDQPKEGLEVKSLVGLEVPTGVPLAGLDESGFQHLLVPISADEHPTGNAPARGISITPRVLVDQDEEKRYLDIASRLPSHRRLFASVCDSVIERLSTTAGHVGQITLEVVSNFRELLGTIVDGLPSSKLIGMFGELHVLRRLVSEDPTAVAAWTGPAGEPHDFTTSQLSLEVKTSRSSSRSVRVHGLDQLAPFGDRDLFLIVMQISQDEAHGVSVREMVSELVEFAADRDFLERRLFELGFDDDLRCDRDEERWSVHSEDWYRIDEDFPKLTRSQLVDGRLQEGIGGLGYTVDLRAVGAGPMNLPEVEAILRSVVMQ